MSTTMHAGCDHNQIHGDAVGTGFLSGPGFRDLPVQYTVVDGKYALCDGCIYMGTVEEVEADAARIRASAKETPEAKANHASDAEIAFGVAMPDYGDFLWPNGIVPYAFDSGLPQPQRVNDAIAHMHENTGIRLVLRTAANAAQFPNYVVFVRSSTPGVSWSSLGMRGGRQEIAVADGHPMGVICHEMLHALGILHEQTRTDRDRFVQIRWENIQPNRVSQFQILPGVTDLLDYDYGSIMHYGGSAFSSNGQPTIVPLQPGVTIGQRNALSYTDRQTVAKMYERFFAKGYSGVWRPGTGAYGLWVNATSASFVDKWQQWSQQGLRLTDIHVRHVGGQDRYSGVFEAGSGGHGLWMGASWSSFHDKWQEWSQAGLRLVDLHIHRANGENRYSGVFRAGGGGHGLWVNASWASLKEKWESWSQQGLRLIDLHVHRINGQTRYSGVFRSGSGGYGLWADASWTSFVAKWQELSQQGLKLVDLNHHLVGATSRYSGVFAAGGGGQYLWANVTYDSFIAKWQELAEQNFRLVDFEIVQSEDGAANSLDMAPMAADAAHGDGPSRELAENGFGGVIRPELLVPDSLPAPTVTPTMLDRLDALGAMVASDDSLATRLDSGEGMGELVLVPGPDGSALETGGEAVGGVVLSPEAAVVTPVHLGNGQNHAGYGSHMS
jgi:hypothetical protein